MQDLQQHQTIECEHGKDGVPSESALPKASLSSALVKAGDQFGRLKVICAEPQLRKERRYYQVICTTCGKEGWREQGSLRQGTAGCRYCAKPRIVPKWLYRRAQSAQERCIRPRNKQYKNYGARGIEFRFSSPLAMGLWVMENLGIHKDMFLDRIDNDGHYEPGNIRWIDPLHSVVNSRRNKHMAAFHAFREKYPEVRYADATLYRFLSQGLTLTQIRERYYQVSCKPKGVYGTFSTPAHDIASQWKDS